MIKHEDIKRYHKIYSIPYVCGDLDKQLVLSIVYIMLPEQCLLLEARLAVFYDEKSCLCYREYKVSVLSK